MTSHGNLHFLNALGLTPEADERSIRRAYAQRLKRIDQETEPQAFQALRIAYESALAWVERQTAGRLPADEPVVSPMPVSESAARLQTETVTRGDASPQAGDAPRVEPGDPQTLAEQVFDRFAQVVSRILVDENSARRALDAALGDDRLVNLEARTLFEWRVACLLLDGWCPGHEFLFGPACERFNWEQDRRRLSLFGQAGAVLDAAINEKLIFFRQPPAEFEVQRHRVRALRDDHLPDKRTLVEEMPHLEMLAQHFPHWLRIVTSRDNFMRRRQALEAMPAEELEALRRSVAAKLKRVAKKSADAVPKTKSSINPLWWVLVVLVLGKIVSGLSEPARGPVRLTPALLNSMSQPAQERAPQSSPLNPNPNELLFAFPPRHDAAQSVQQRRAPAALKIDPPDARTRAASNPAQADVDKSLEETRRMLTKSPGSALWPERPPTLQAPTLQSVPAVNVQPDSTLQRGSRYDLLNKSDGSPRTDFDDGPAVSTGRFNLLPDNRASMPRFGP